MSVTEKNIFTQGFSVCKPFVYSKDGRAWNEICACLANLFLNPKVKFKSKSRGLTLRHCNILFNTFLICEEPFGGNFYMARLWTLLVIHIKPKYI